MGRVQHEVVGAVLRTRAARGRRSRGRALRQSAAPFRSCRTNTTTHLQGEAAALGDNPGPEPHVVGLDHAAPVPGPVHHAEVHRVRADLEPRPGGQAGEGPVGRDQPGALRGVALGEHLGDGDVDLVRVGDEVQGVGVPEPHRLDAVVQPVRLRRVRGCAAGRLLEDVECGEGGDAVRGGGHLVDLDPPVHRLDGVLEQRPVPPQVLRAQHPALALHRRLRGPDSGQSREGEGRAFGKMGRQGGEPRATGVCTGPAARAGSPWAVGSPPAPAGGGWSRRPGQPPGQPPPRCERTSTARATRPS